MMSIQFAPMFPWIVIAALGAASILLLIYGLFCRARGLGWRFLTLAALLAALANPILVSDDRESLPDVVAVVVDESPSQDIARRQTQTDDAIERVRRRLEGLDDVDVRFIRAGNPGTDAKGPTDGTRIFDTLGKALANVPSERMAATIVVTDGQVHDVPAPESSLPFKGPMHVLLTGDRRERDRRIVVENAPGFGLVGKPTEIRIRIEDKGREGEMARVKLTREGGQVQTRMVPIGRTESVTLPIEHAGANLLQIEVDRAENELTEINNRSVVQVNGVRERLRVLLVSGEPHPGERVWRNLLKADPSVDLVHFTILRPPEKQDATPVRELSLIAFPIRELFEVKLEDFDLIIFDRYRRRGVLPSIYLDNIVRYVQKGGAVLEAAGPAYATALSLHRTPLGNVLPGEPTGRVHERGLKPRLTEFGGRHPVTADLPGATDEIPRWGRWFRQIDVSQREGLALMSGVENKPLLIVHRVGEGRVAQLLSDHIWLWARGFEDGGPHSELLRRLAHWLMKEPDLEEDDLRARLDGNRLVIVRRSVEIDKSPVVVTAPSGKTTTVPMEEGIGGRSRGTTTAAEVGIYRISDGKRSALAAVGNLNPLEYADMRATEQKLGPLAAATGGGMFWLQDGMPELRRVRAGRRTTGSSWLGLVENRQFRVTRVREVPLLPGLALLIVGLGALMLAWRREGR